MDTTILIVTYKSQQVIYNCLDSINKKIPVVVVENSSDQNFKKKLEDKYLNVRCFLTNDNLGFANGNNFGLNLITTKYVFLLNPDTILQSDTLDVLAASAKKINDFALLAPLSSNDLNFGFFNNMSIKKIENNHEIFEVDYIKGFAMFFNKNKFINIGFFDPNIFIYFEEIDLCRRLKKINEKIYLISKAKINHGGGKSHGNIFDIEMELSRNWHYMWSKFYYYNKHFGKIRAYKKTLNYFFFSFFKLLFYFFCNKKKHLIYKSRFLGLLNSYFGRKSHYRPFSFNKIF
jgi:N-acetylglucosaminyl-diphospho-decaprenol L-rhamnosyltransferase